jgi:hypothetical protein
MRAIARPLPIAFCAALFALATAVMPALHAPLAAPGAHAAHLAHGSAHAPGDRAPVAGPDCVACLLTAAPRASAGTLGDGAAARLPRRALAIAAPVGARPTAGLAPLRGRTPLLDA